MSTWRGCGRTFAALEPYTAPTGYVNYLADDDSDRIASAYRPNFDRLVEVKQLRSRQHFRLNQNINLQHELIVIGAYESFSSRQ
jgi:hypothetical protein